MRFQLLTIPVILAVLLILRLVCLGDNVEVELSWMFSFVLSDNRYYITQGENRLFSLLSLL
jgi:hypothetical protein